MAGCREVLTPPGGRRGPFYQALCQLRVPQGVGAP